MGRAISGHNSTAPVTFPCLTQTRDLFFGMPEHLGIPYGSRPDTNLGNLPARPVVTQGGNKKLKPNSRAGPVGGEEFLPPLQEVDSGGKFYHLPYLRAHLSRRRGTMS